MLACIPGNRREPVPCQSLAKVFYGLHSWQSEGTRTLPKPGQGLLWPAFLAWSEPVPCQSLAKVFYGLHSWHGVNPYIAKAWPRSSMACIPGNRREPVPCQSLARVFYGLHSWQSEGTRTLPKPGQGLLWPAFLAIGGNPYRRRSSAQTHAR
jgi:hypothetical protein